MVRQNSWAAMVGEPKAQKPARPSRRWSAAGVSNLVHLDAEDTAKINQALRCRGVPRTSAFKTGLENAWRQYKTAGVVVTKSSPRAVRGNLKRALSTTEQMFSSLEALDMNSQLLISDGDHTRWEALLDHSIAIHTALSRAESLALSQYSARGRLPDHAKTQFAAQVAKLLKDNRTPPTSAKTGVFVRILCAMLGLKSASGHRVAVHGLKLLKSGTLD